MTTQTQNIQTDSTTDGLRQYLEDSVVDPVQAQMNMIHLDIIKSLDKDRIADKTRYNLQQVIRSGQHTAWFLPRQQEVGVIDEKFAPSNLHPYAMMVGQNAYRRFTFDKLYHTKTPQPGKLTFNVHRKNDILSKGYLHKHDISFKDQVALDEVRKRQLGEEIHKVRKIAKDRSDNHEHIGVANQTIAGQIAHIANPLNVFTTPNEDTDAQMSAMQNIVQNELGQPGPSTTIDALRHALGNRVGRTATNRMKFDTGAVERKQTIAERRRKGKGAVLGVNTNIGKDATYDVSTWRHPGEEYQWPGRSGGDVGIFDDRNYRPLHPFVDRFDRYPPGLVKLPFA